MTTPSFPVSALSSRVARRRRRARRLVAAVALVAAVSGTGVAYATVRRADPAAYRTATVETRDVDAVLTSVATIEPVIQAAVAFPVGGTVATVDAAVGASVTAGQQLATLDAAALERTLRTRQAALAQAQLVLATALDGGDVSALTGGGGGMSSPVVSLVGAIVDPTSIRLSDVDAGQIGSAQQAVLAAQQAVDAARTRAANALSSAISVCAAVGADVSGADPTATQSSIASCQAALDEVVDAQGAVDDAQGQVAAAAATLDDLVAAYADGLLAGATTTTEPTEPTTASTGEPTTGPVTGPTDTTAATDDDVTTADATAADVTTRPIDPSPAPTADASPTGDGAAAGARPSGSGATAGGAPSATGSLTVSSPSSEDLIAYQAAVDAAAAAVTVAEQAIAQATITSPIDGTVVVVGLVPGDDATAASTTQQIVIEGAGGYEAATTISVDDITDVEVGQTATVLPDGSSDPVTGHVATVAAVPDDAASTTSYGVVIALDGDTSGLGNGSIGTASIVTATATGVLAVPASAVTTSADRSTVTIVVGATATDVPVETGIVGATWIEVRRGLTAGQDVSVADLSEPLPGSATATAAAATTVVVVAGPGGFPGRPGG